MTAFEFDEGWDAQDERRNHNELLPGEIVLWRNAQWRITTRVIEEKADPGVFGPPYWIDNDTLTLSDPNLVTHVTEKNWVDRALFIEAYAKACELLGITPVGLEPRPRDELDEVLDGMLASPAPRQVKPAAWTPSWWLEGQGK